MLTTLSKSPKAAVFGTVAAAAVGLVAAATLLRRRRQGPALQLLVSVPMTCTEYRRRQFLTQIEKQLGAPSLEHIRIRMEFSDALEAAGILHALHYGEDNKTYKEYFVLLLSCPLGKSPVVPLCRVPMDDRRVFQTVPAYAIRDLQRRVLRATGAAPSATPPKGDKADARDAGKTAAMDLLIRTAHGAMIVKHGGASMNGKDSADKESDLLLLSEFLPQSDRVAALWYIIDVVGAGGDPLLCRESCAERVATYLLAVFRDLASLNAFFAECGVEKLVLAPTETDMPTLHHLANFVIDNTGLLGGAAMERRPAMASLGVPLALFFVPYCSYDSFRLLKSVYESALQLVGGEPLNTEAFGRLLQKLGGPTRGSTRIFRCFNRSRSGEISFDEFVAYFGRRLSTPHSVFHHKDQHLLSALEAVGLLRVLFPPELAHWTESESCFRCCPHYSSEEEG